eukprot:15441338-Alexandrium_andersonii.AAC.1
MLSKQLPDAVPARAHTRVPGKRVSEHAWAQHAEQARSRHGALGSVASTLSAHRLSARSLER